jgi:hypothetical protein
MINCRSIKISKGLAVKIPALTPIQINGLLANCKSVGVKFGPTAPASRMEVAVEKRDPKQWSLLLIDRLRGSGSQPEM